MKYALLIPVLALAQCSFSTAELPSMPNVDTLTDAARAKVEDAVRAAAAKAFDAVKAKGAEYLADGPCIAENVVPGWVIDIAHEPRLPVDDLPENQCAAYRDGTATHFVELSPEGKILRIVW